MRINVSIGSFPIAVKISEVIKTDKDNARIGAENPISLYLKFIVLDLSCMHLSPQA
tara:strand:- start:1 stop:168 length:168 start_codon:yes stop_codon:yes gene_type:complete